MVTYDFRIICIYKLVDFKVNWSQYIKEQLFRQAVVYFLRNHRVSEHIIQEYMNQPYETQLEELFEGSIEALTEI